MATHADEILAVAHIVVKFSDHHGPPYPGDPATAAHGIDHGCAELAAEFPDIRLRPMFTSASPQRIRELAATGKMRDRSYVPPDFLSYFVVNVTASTPVDRLTEVLRRCPKVEVVYFDPLGEDPSAVSPDDDLPHFPKQGYLKPACEGIDAIFAWNFTGGDGCGQEFIDMEKGWELLHEDLKKHGADVLHGDIQPSSIGHGTSVLGEVCGVDNKVGVVGITPNLAKVNVVSYYTSTRPDAMLAAIDALPYGGVLLLEAVLKAVDVPIEVQRADFDVIRLATAVGITVIAAAGNSAKNLNLVTDANGKFVLDPNHADGRDSGAILVGAARSAVPHARLSSSNHGTRVECYAWGQNVVTTDSTSALPLSDYREDFSHTSSAAPIVAGAALAVQGVAEARLGYRLNAYQMRQLLANKANGTPSANPPADKIGVMPDLYKLLNSPQIGVAPDVYLRDFVGDDGTPHGGAISASPDVILRSTQVPDPTAAFGAGSGTENDGTLGDLAIEGRDNYIYIRARNRGGSAAADARVDVYWAPLSSLPTPDSWTLIGSAALASVPAADVLTVFDAITWPAAKIPASGPYSLVAIAGSSLDPTPQMPASMTFERFRRLIRDNNNVTWRSFNVVDIEPSMSIGGTEVAPLDFIVGGAPDVGLMMDVEVFARLPEGSRVFLEVPPEMYRNLSYALPAEPGTGKSKGNRLIPMNPHGSRTLRDVRLPRGARFETRLMVHVPAKYRHNAYQAHVRQVHEGVELGRVTWRLARKRRPQQSESSSPSRA